MILAFRPQKTAIFKKTQPETLKMAKYQLWWTVKYVFWYSLVPMEQLHGLQKQIGKPWNTISSIQPGALKKTKNSQKEGKDFVFRRRDIDFWNPRRILHKKQSTRPGVFEYIFQK